ncbi:hypothetical protein FH972_022772 [Carpinus fangiana]|uniref:Ams2/SPT21 N-terminal domain-containing protein n=1 Tax=Carpinus fangiana TaxID=176857 RepID=A0A5N6KTJ3_9ROSI|nr:hypothetical protein FH972_022772 [Carpinus fangiana]
MYSSPAASGPGSRPASPHIMAPQASQSPVPPGSKFMQVKVLYSFDDGNKTNCLARCPQPVPIQTAQLDETTQIGIIELRLCIQAIVSASPELVAKLGQDYTVYAYDYSEYETPLVGQGMLSWVLASASTTPNAPAHASRTMVTGRVCKNILGLFSSGGATETLEVKLRLVPVPTCLQSEYLESMQKYRNASSHAVEGFDGDAWSNFLRANPGFGMSPPADQSATPGIDMPLEDMVDLDFPSQHEVHQMSAHSEYGGQLSPFTQGQDSPFNFEQQHESRPTTSAQHQSHERVPSRTASRASNHSRRGSQASRRPSMQQQTSATSSREDSAPAQEPSYIQDGPRKRARIEKTDWRGPPSFNSRSASLLRTASAAASIRNQGPATSSKYPSVADIAAGEIGPRPPTPISKPFQRRLLHRSSMSAQERPRTSYRSPYALDQDNMDSSASIASSPPMREASIASTPFDGDIPSSPPVITRNHSAAPSSPGLPPLQHADSGFVSGSLEEYMNDDDEMTPGDYEDLKQAARYKSRSNAGLNKSHGNDTAKSNNEIVFDLDASLNMEMPGDPRQLPTSSDPRKKNKLQNKPAPPKSSAQAKPKASKARTSKVSVKTAPSSPRLPPLPMPLDASNDGYIPVTSMPPPQHLPQSELARERSESFSMEPQSEAGAAGQKDGSGTKRKRAIEARLRADIAKGIAPQYCKNCGQIETPTWRKCFVAFVQEVPDDIKISEEEFGIWCVEPMKDEEKGVIINYALIRRSIRKEEADQWQETQLCNPCGIHLFKNKRMRPKEKFLADGSKDKEAEVQEKPKRQRNRKKKTDLAGGPEPSSFAPESEMDSAWQLPEMPSGRSDKSVAKTSGRSDRSQPKTAGRTLQRSASMGGAQMPQPRRSGMANGAAVAALQRAIQSSPPRFPGSKHSPIELDGDKSADTTRRLLFPSPRKNGEMKSLDPSKRDDSSRDSGSVTPDESQMDKENMPPPAQQADDDDSLRHLFGATPRTPKSGGRGVGDLLRTPRSTNTNSLPRGILTSSAKRWAAANAAPETPTRSAQRAPGMTGQEEMTPWTRQLNDMLSEANAPMMSDNFNTFSDATGMNDGAFAFSDFSVADGQDGFGFSLYEDPQSATGDDEWDIDELLAGDGQDQ